MYLVFKYIFKKYLVFKYILSMYLVFKYKKVFSAQLWLRCTHPVDCWLDSPMESSMIVLYSIYVPFHLGSAQYRCCITFLLICPTHYPLQAPKPTSLLSLFTSRRNAHFSSPWASFSTFVAFSRQDGFWAAPRRRWNWTGGGILQFNCNSIQHCHVALQNFPYSHQVLLTCLQETKLGMNSILNEFTDYATTKRDHPRGGGGGLITLSGCLMVAYSQMTMR